ncbi:MAG: tRNA lysidine(34) synthetase TilS [Elusimicrobiota bacterium]
MITDTLLDFFQDNHSLFKPSDKILLACSGGVDSVVLAAALKKINDKFPYTFILGHVNHHLRGSASDLDEKSVRALAKKLGFKVVVAQAPLKGTKTGIEEKARLKRYLCLEKMATRFGCMGIMTAHTLNDQAETVLMNLIRGCGPHGLSGIPPLRKIGHTDKLLFRPFLNVSKKEILEFSKKNHYSFRLDKSNKNEAFLRNWLRQSVIPEFENRNPGFSSRINNLSNLLRDEELYWADKVYEMSKILLKEVKSGWLLDFKGLLSYSAAEQRRFLRALIGENILTFDALENLRQWMARPPSNARRWTLRKGWIVERLSKSQGFSSASIFWIGQIHRSQQTKQTKDKN